MGPGRRPKPTAMKELAGNPGRRALNYNEPRAIVCMPSCPMVVTGEARKEFRRIARLLANMGVVVEADRALLIAYAVAYGRWMDAEKIIAEQGVVLKTEKGKLIQNPYLLVSNRAFGQMCKLATEFGLTPASRSRVSVGAPLQEPTLTDVLFDLVVPQAPRQPVDSEDVI